MTTIPASSAREFAQLLGPLRRAVLKATRLAAQLPDLSDPQIEVLRLLSNEGPAAPNQMAARLQLAPSTLSNVLKAMTKAGLTERARRTDDQRRVDIAISPHARELLNTYDATSLRAIEDFLAGLTERERSAFEVTVPVLRRMCVSFAAAADSYMGDEGLRFPSAAGVSAASAIPDPADEHDHDDRGNPHQ